MQVFRPTVEKRIAAIQRWLERAKQSYASGAVESALMDTECARADLEGLRKEVWCEAGNFPRKNYSRPVLKAVSLAAIAVMASVTPLAKDPPLPPAVHDPITLTLAEPIIIVREETPPAPAPQPQKEKTPARRTTARKTARKTPPAPAPAPSRTESTPAKKVAYDKVASLVQTGERALKKTSTVIKRNKQEVQP